VFDIDFQFKSISNHHLKDVVRYRKSFPASINTNKPYLKRLAIQHKSNKQMSIKSNLENAVNGLQMMSESDYPFEYFSTDDTTINPAIALKITGQPEGTVVETTTLDYLLRNMTDPASGSVSPSTAKQFQQMATVLKGTLQELTVFRIGQTQVDVLIIGLTPEGTAAGYRTKLIET
jgi:hypothetical protein